MAQRPLWKGFLRIRLVSVPIKVFTAKASGRKIALRTLHRDCGSPLNYRPSCPLHGEVESDAVVSGYRCGEGRYVRLEREDLEALRGGGPEKVVEIEGFLPEDSLDPLYLTGKNYFLLPEGAVGERAYGVLCRVMKEGRQGALGRLSVAGHKEVVFLRPRGRVFSLSVLRYGGEVREPGDFEGALEAPEVTREERKLAEALLDAAALGAFEPARYPSEYDSRLTALIEAKVAGREIARAPEAEAPKVVALLEALRESVAREKARRRGKKAAPSARGKRPRRKRKTS